MQRALAPTPAVQRYPFTNPDWSTTKEVIRFGAGMFGASLFKDGTDKPLIVKASTEPVPETLLATVFHGKLTEKKRGISTVPVRTAAAAEKDPIVAQVTEKVPPGTWRKLAEANKAYPKNGPPEKQEEFVLEYKEFILKSYRSAGNTLFVQGAAEGTDMKGLASDPQRGARNVAVLLSDPSYANRLGFIHAIDLFLGNVDRLEAMNLGNWMTKVGTLENSITAIDNFDPAGNQLLTASVQQAWKKDQLLHLKKPRATAEVIINDGKFGLISKLKEAGADIAAMYSAAEQGAIKVQLVASFEKGMKEGISTITSKLAPRIGKRSRTLKAATVQQAGDEAWALLKERAALLR